MVSGRRHGTLVVGTRASQLAMAQTDIVVGLLRSAHPEWSLQVREISTGGDRDQVTPLARIGGQGIFVKEIEISLLSGEIDLAVHSLKDVPTVLPEGLCLGAILPRGDPTDALVSRLDLPLEKLPMGARVGTSALRRQAQLRALRPDLTIAELRGNVDTRLRKADAGEYDAIVLASAGLRRLGLFDRTAEVLSPEMMLPAVGQGAICVQVRSDDRTGLGVVSRLDDAATHACTSAERSFLRELGTGCRAPVAAYAVVAGQRIQLRGLIADAAGARLVRGETRGALIDADALGQELAQRLLNDGGQALLTQEYERD